MKVQRLTENVPGSKISKRQNAGSRSPRQLAESVLICVEALNSVCDGEDVKTSWFMIFPSASQVQV